jgi:hypothetical protein
MKYEAYKKKNKNVKKAKTQRSEQTSNNINKVTTVSAVMETALHKLLMNVRLIQDKSEVNFISTNTAAIIFSLVYVCA